MHTDAGEKLGSDDSGHQELYVSNNTQWVTNYKEQLQGLYSGSLDKSDSGIPVQNGRLINSSGKLYDTGNTVYEVTGKIPVTPGDIYYLSNFGQYCAFYDQNGNYINTTCNASWYSRSYIVIPENVGYISLGNYLWSTDAGYDRSILNGIKFNETGSFNIVFLKLGNLADIYKDKLTQGPSNNNGSSKDKMYANLRVQLKDGVNGYLAKGGSWNMVIYQVANTSGTEVSDEDL